MRKKNQWTKTITKQKRKTLINVNTYTQTINIYIATKNKYFV